MRTRRLGRTNYAISRFILGCGNFGGIGSDPRFFGMGESESDAMAIMDAAWQAGINCFDTADAYGGGRSEEWIGNWSAEQDVQPVIATKVFHSVHGDPNDVGLSPERISRQVQDSLKRLRRKRIDLYLIHEPDHNTPLESTLEALDELVRAGHVGAIGASNVDKDYLESSLEISERRGFVRFEWVQNEFNLINQGANSEILPFCMRHGLGFTPFSPLCGGWLTGKYEQGQAPPPGSRMTLRPEPYREMEREATYLGLDRLREFAHGRGVDMAAISLSWVSSHPGVTATVLGPRRVAHLEPALASERINLTDDDRAEMASFFRH